VYPTEVLIAQLREFIKQRVMRFISNMGSSARSSGASKSFTAGEDKLGFGH